MTKPTPKPTVASLQRELTAERKESAKLREYLSRSQEAHDTTRRELSRSIDEHRNNWLREVAGLQIERDALQEKIETVRADLAPLLAYLQSGWLGPVHGSYQRLKAFVEGK